MDAAPEGEAADAHGATRVLSMLLVAFTISAAALGLISTLGGAVKDEFALTALQSGPLLNLALALVFALCVLPLAWLADRINRRWLITLCLMLWGGALIGCGFAWNAWQALGACAAALLGLAGLMPAAHSIIADYRYQGERARAIAIISMGAPIGLIGGALAAGWITQAYSWRIACFGVGGLGILAAILFRIVIWKGRPRHEPITHDDHEQVFYDERPRRAHKPSLFHLTAGLALTAFVGFAFIRFTYAMLMRNYALSDFHAGALAALIGGVAGAVGLFAGGALAQSLVARDLRWQVYVPALACLAAGAILMAGLMQRPLWLLSVVMVLGGVLHAMSAAPALASVQDASAPTRRAMSAGWRLFFIGIVGMGLGPFASGALSGAFAAANFEPDLMYHGMDYATACIRQGVLSGNEEACAAAAASGLRQAMFVISGLYLWAALHFFRAARTLHQDCGLRQPAPKPKKRRRSIHDDEHDDQDENGPRYA